MNNLQPVNLNDLVAYRTKPLIGAVEKKNRIKLVILTIILIVALVMHVLLYKNTIDLHIYVTNMSYLLIAILFLLE